VGTINRKDVSMADVFDKYRKIHDFTFKRAFTYADMRKGHTDKEKREYIREEAGIHFLKKAEGVLKWKWAFRIHFKKSGKRRFDVENVPKLIVDAFCDNQIEKDKSKYGKVALYKDDTVDHVELIQVSGERVKVKDEEETRVEIFRRQ